MPHVTWFWCVFTMQCHFPTIIVVWLQLPADSKHEYCWISGSHAGCEEFCNLGLNFVSSSKTQLMFQKNISPPASGLKSRSSLLPASSCFLAWLTLWPWSKKKYVPWLTHQTAWHCIQEDSLQNEYWLMFQWQLYYKKLRYKFWNHWQNGCFFSISKFTKCWK
jgi:hypothetical protein